MCRGSGESLGAGGARSRHLPEQAQHLEPQPEPERPPVPRGNRGVASAAARCGTWGGPAGPGPNLGQAWGRPGLRLPGEKRAGRETSLKSYLQDRAHRGASKQLAFGAHPKYPDNSSPVLSALDLRRLGFSPRGHHDNLGVWGNHLLESLDDVRSRCDFYQVKNHAQAPAPRPPPGALAASAPPRGRGRRRRKPAPGSPPRSAINHVARARRAPPGVLRPAAGGAAPPEPGAPLLRVPPTLRPACPAGGPPRRFPHDRDLCREQTKAARVSGRPAQRARPPRG